MNALSEMDDTLMFSHSFAYFSGFVKQMPLLSADFDENLDISNDQLAESDLKVMYEKKGAVCTDVNGYQRSPIMLIAVCPWNTPQSNIKTFCEQSQDERNIYYGENIIDFLYTPVQDDNGFVYKNIYCAQCNNVIEPVPWMTKLDCDDMQPLQLSDGSEKIFILGEDTNQDVGCTRQLRPEIPRMIHECKFSEVKEKYGTRIHQTRTGSGRNDDYSPFPLSFSILMNFGFDGKTHILFSSSQDEQLVSNKCSDGQTYDPGNDKCRKISCDEGYDLVKNTCIRKETYGADTTSNDIAYLKDIGETVQVVLTIKNVSNGEIFLLQIPSVEETLVYSLAERFNISKDRLANLTLSVVNGTATTSSSTENEVIEIHRFTTPMPEERSHKIPSPNSQGKNDHALNNGKQYIPPVKDYKDTNGSPETFDEPSHQLNVTAVANGSKTNNSDLYLMANHTGHMSSSGIDEPSKVTSSASASLSSKGPYGFQSEEPDLNQLDAWRQYRNLNVRVSFLLMPAKQNMSKNEKSVQNVVKNMNDLISRNSFSITINGTDFQVDGLENPPNPTPLDQFCTNGEFASFSGDEFEMVPGYDSDRRENMTLVKVNATGQEFRPGEYDLTVVVDGTVGNLKSTKVTSFVFVCIMPKIEEEECGRIILGESEYKRFDNKTVLFQGKLLNTSEYEYDNNEMNTIKICAPKQWSDSQTVTNTTRWTMVCGDDLLKLAVAESYLTFILGVISLASLLTVLITYTLFDKLRNLPGVNTMNLTISIFLGQMVFIVSGSANLHYAWLCSAVGMFLHYLFLASFFWMNVMAYDVFRTFAKKCILTRIREKKKFLPRYALYAWGSPLLIVLLCAVFDFTEILPDIKIGYGGQFQTGSSQSDSFEGSANRSTTEDTDTSHVYSLGCWIQQPVATLAAFGGPMVLILLGNTVMFTRTIICIRSSTKLTQTSVRRSSISHMAGHDDVMLYIRMSTVMGFTWIFGLTSSIVSGFFGEPSRTICIVLHLLAILFIIFNCSQGLFIFFAFVFNRRVLGLYRGLVFKLRSSNSRPRPLSSSSSRSTLGVRLSQTSLSHIT